MRDGLAAGFAAIVVGAALLAGWWLLSTQRPEDPQDAVEAVADDYLEAWQGWNLDRMEALVRDPPASFAGTHTTLRDALNPETTRITRTAVTRDGGRATTDLQIDLTLADGMSVRWTSQLALQRAGGVWRVVWTPQTVHPELRAGFGWRIDEIPASRAPILGLDDEPLTALSDMQVVGIEPRRIEDRPRLRQTVAQYAPDALDTLDALLARDDLHPTWFYELTRLPATGSADVVDQLDAVPGVVVREEKARAARSDGFAQHVLGRVDPADTGGSDGGTEEPTSVGRYGLEQVFDDELTGHGGRRVVITEPDGEVHALVATVAEDPADPVHTTLDAVVQQAVENALVGAAHPTAVVLVDPRTGEIRAVAARPLTGYDRALEGRYAPGPGFRLVTAAALLTAGHSPDEQVDCPSTTVAGGRRVANPGGVELGTTTLREAVMGGCDTTLARLAADLPPGVLTETAVTMGFRDTFDLPLDTVDASFPDPVDAGERAVAAVGLGRVLASPLQMATVVAAAGTGIWHAPALLRSAPDNGSRPVTDRTSHRLDPAVGPLGDWLGTDGIGGRVTTPGQDRVDEWYVGLQDEFAVAVLVEGAAGEAPVAQPIAARVHAELAALRG